MTASRVTPPVEEKGTEIEGAKEAGEVVVSVRGCFSQSLASLRLTDSLLMSPMIEK